MVIFDLPRDGRIDSLLGQLLILVGYYVKVLLILALKLGNSIILVFKLLLVHQFHVCDLDPAGLGVLGDVAEIRSPAVTLIGDS